MKARECYKMCNNVKLFAFTNCKQRDSSALSAYEVTMATRQMLRRQCRYLMNASNCLTRTCIFHKAMGKRIHTHGETAAQITTILFDTPNWTQSTMRHRVSEFRFCFERVLAELLNPYWDSVWVTRTAQTATHENSPKKKKKIDRYYNYVLSWHIRVLFVSFYIVLWEDELISC